MPLLEICIFEQVIFDPIFGLVITLTFDLSTSKSSQFIIVPNCSEVVNLAKFSEAACTNVFTNL